MVDGQHKLSRRALLGAVCASPLVRRPGLDPGSTFSSQAPEGRRWIPDQVRDVEEGGSFAVAIWNRALARFQEAQAVLDGARSEPEDDAYDALLDVHSDALRALLALPAPDRAGLAAKLDVIVAHLAWEQTGAEDCLERARQDAHRLAVAYPLTEHALPDPDYAP